MRRPAGQTIAFLILGWLLASSAGAQATLMVPSQFPSIQMAITAAVNGDTILVAPGTYVENISPTGKAITIKSSAGPAVTIIDGNTTAPPISVISGESSQTVIEGFTLSNGLGFPVAFINNVAIRAGGGIYIFNSSPIIRDCIIENNFATRGGGVDCSGSPFFDRCIIRNNAASSKGGGVGMLPGGLAVFENCQIVGNTAATAGGGLAIEGSVTAFLVNCLVAGNSVPGPTTINNPTRGGGIFVHSGASLTVASTTIANNFAASGGGIGSDGSIGSVVVRNSVIWSNAGQSIVGVSGIPVVQYSCIAGGHVGTGNLSTSPDFVDLLGGDYHLSLGSPCVNSGTSATFFLAATDIDGDLRNIFGAPDMGYDEVTDISAAPAMAGNVGMLMGIHEELLQINGEGGGGDRRVFTAVGQANEVAMLQPATSMNPVNFAIFGYFGSPTPNDIVSLPLGIGEMAFTPHVLIPWAFPLVFSYTHSAGAIPGAAIASTPTPWISGPQIGLPIPLTISFQGVVEESPGVLRATNCVILEVR